MEQRVGGGPQEQELPGPKAPSSSPVDLPAKRLEEVGHKLNLFDHDETAHLFVEIEIGFFQDPTVGAPFHVEADSISRFGDLLSEGGLADPPRAKEDHARLTRQSVFDGLPIPAWHHALHLFHGMEDLQGICMVCGRSWGFECRM